MPVLTPTEPALRTLEILADRAALGALLDRVPWLHGPEVGTATIRLRWKPGVNVRAGLLVRTAHGTAALLVADLGLDTAKADKLHGQLTRNGAPVLREGNLLAGPATADPALRRRMPALEPLAYNPDRRFVGRESAVGGESVVKVYATAPDRAVRGLATLVSGTRWEHARVARTPWVAGREPGPDDADAVAAALRTLHRTPVPAGLPVLDATAGLAGVHRAAASVVATRPSLRERVHRLVLAIERSVDDWPRPDAVVHGDLSRDQLLITDDGRGVLLDLDRAAHGPAAWDGAVWAAAEIADPRPLPVPAPIDSPPVLRAAALLQRAPEPFRRMRPDWLARTDALITAAEQALENPRECAVSYADSAVPHRLTDAWGRLPAGMAVRRSWPGRDGDLTVEVVVDGAPGLAGVVIGADRVRVRHRADPKLPALESELARPGAELLGHRPGRRAVLRVAGTYVKIVRPGRAVPVAQALCVGARLARGAEHVLVVPAVTDVDDTAGVVRLAAVTGPTLHALLGAGSPRATVTVARLVDALDLLAAGPTGDLPQHTVDDEVAVVAQWAGHAAAWGGPNLHDTAARIGAALRELPAVARVVTHRDLHDKQVVAVGPAVGLLDLDTLCAAHPALDRGNLLAHLQLRVLQGHCPPALAAACTARLRRGDRAEAVHTAAALLRLAGVYFFRPGPSDLPDRLHAAAEAALA